MLLNVENIGAIGQASIKLDGLTVIAGENDTGKSFIGKMLFSIIKAFNRYEDELGDDKLRRVNKQIDNIYFWIRRYFPDIIHSDHRSEFTPHLVSKEIQLLMAQHDTKAIDQFIDRKLALLSQLDPEGNTLPVQHKLHELHEMLSSGDNRPVLIQKAMSKALLSEFFFDVNAKLFQDLPAKVAFAENDLSVFDMEIRENRIHSFNCPDESLLYEGLYFTDVTFIETPILLQMYDLVRRSGTLFDLDENDSKNRRINQLANPVIPLHMKDLMRKLENAQYYDPQVATDLFESRLIDRINSIIDGDMIFDERDNDFRFRKRTAEGQLVDLKTINTATGIKSFGILNLLLKIDLLDERSLLIIDEPEVHLHPRWQVEYARIIATLVKHGVSVLIATHSPYIVQALKVCADEMKLNEQTNYYLAERDNIANLSKVEAVNDNLDRVFQKLSQPLQDLVWG